MLDLKEKNNSLKNLTNIIDLVKKELEKEKKKASKLGNGVSEMLKEKLIVSNSSRFVKMVLV